MSKRDRRIEQRGISAPRQLGPASGAVIPVTAPDGSQGFTYQVRLVDLPPPDRQFVAHVVQVEQNACDLELSFGQRLANHERTRTPSYATVTISVSIDYRQRFLDSALQILSPMKKHLAGRNLLEVQPQPFERHPDQIVFLVANVIGVSFAGLESVLDFHYLSPWQYQRLGQGEEPLLDQVVRIQLSTPRCAGLIESVAELASQKP